MHSFPAGSANSYHTLRIRSALASFVDEVCGTLARLCAYLMALALMAICGIALWQHLPDLSDAMAMETPSKDGWSLAARPVPAFAVSQFIFSGKTEAYEIFRHPEGGRKDVFRWSGSAGTLVAELEIYRPGGEIDQVGSDGARTAPDGMRDLEAAGIIDSKFGAVSLFRSAGGAEAGRACVRFFKRVGDSGVQFSGWSCLGGDLAARRAAIGCMLNRLVLLSAGNDTKLAQLFAHAEIRRSDCAASGTPARSADWLTGADNPHLRGAQ
ncbi:hypothetical protein IVB30_00825 [Bradyrhizobium sp. 200]|uniref:hypothetical protein n=1 Tax=Bradyrhizobium sp. 200 TaxID=2782665 RepID=UPI001FFF5E40|nr:hypothetical protein [Bradyrhizobium sp. 200]UPJ50018.1 hypothetical protein IVB30_00825 [Bradyrhizobium sp. 200]